MSLFTLLAVVFVTTLSLLDVSFFSFFSETAESLDNAIWTRSSQCLTVSCPSSTTWSLATRTAVDWVRVLGALVRGFLANSPLPVDASLSFDHGFANDKVEDQDERVLARSPSLSRSSSSQSSWPSVPSLWVER